MPSLPLIVDKDQSLTSALSKWKALLDPLLNATATSSTAPTGSTVASNQGYISEVRGAFCTQAQWQAQAGNGWVLCDGRSVTGSAYALMTGNNTIPDMRATVPRMKDNGKGLDPHGDLALGTYEADQFDSHTHSDAGHVHGSLFSEGYVGWVTGGNVGPVAAAEVGGIAMPIANETATNYANIQANGGSETNAKSTVINYFIRIN